MAVITGITITDASRFAACHKLLPVLAFGSSQTFRTFSFCLVSLFFFFRSISNSIWLYFYKQWSTVPKKDHPLLCTNTWRSTSYFNATAKSQCFNANISTWNGCLRLCCHHGSPCSSYSPVCILPDCLQQLGWGPTDAIEPQGLVILPCHLIIHKEKVLPAKCPNRWELQALCVEEFRRAVLTSWTATSSDSPVCQAASQQVARSIPKPNDVLPTSTPKTRPFRAEGQAELA